MLSSIGRRRTGRDPAPERYLRGGAGGRRVAETFEIRRASSVSAERVVGRLTPDLLARFEAIIDAMERPVSSERDRTDHERKNVELHTLLVEASDNRRLAELYRSLNAH